MSKRTRQPLEIKEEASSNEPSQEALAFSKFLLGTAKKFKSSELPLLNELVIFGIACDAGEDGWMRGFRWHEYNRKV